MKLIKHFDFTTMKELDNRDWTIAMGKKWANNEVQQYVNDEENLFFDDGLNIRATYRDGIVRSARIHTKDKFYFKYGKIDIIAKVPSGKGTWPALWMMPQEAKYGHWPKSGEIDIMEHVGNEPNKIYTCIHTESYNHRLKEQYFKIYQGKNIPDVFHKYSLKWEKDTITYYLDDQEITVYHRGEEGKDTGPKGWPFDEYFYLIINLAIGGTLGGNVDYTMFPQTFVVKDIKVYQE